MNNNNLKLKQNHNQVYYSSKLIFLLLNQNFRTSAATQILLEKLNITGLRCRLVLELASMPKTLVFIISITNKIKNKKM